MKNKLFSLIMAICLILPCAAFLVGCTGSESNSKIMNVSLNPGIEFILDKNNNVISVNALNEEGNHIISLSMASNAAESSFNGLKAEDAVKLFLELTEQNGYLITGNEEEIEIDITGSAENLMQKIEDKANAFFEEKGINISIEKDTITKAGIIEEVKNCMKEYSQTELESMTQEELIDLLKTSREETKNFLTEELKDAYYNMRIEKINIAEFEALCNIIEDIPGSQNILLTTFQSNMQTLVDNLEALEMAYNEQLLLETSAFNIAKQQYITAKQELLDKRLELAVGGISEQEKTILDGYETLVENAETALETAEDLAKQAISTAKTILNNILNTISLSVEQVKTLLETLGTNIDSLKNAKEQAKDGFKEYFVQNEHFAEFVGNDKCHWGQQQSQ